MSSLRASLSLLFVIALAVASAATRAQPQRVEREPGVSGYVLAADGTPVSGGTVVTQSPGIVATTLIDRTGRFRFVPPRSGIHQVLVSVPGLTPYRATVTVPPSRSLRLPVIRLETATVFRVRLVSPAGEPIIAPQLRRRSFDASGQPIVDGLGDRISESADNDGTINIGPLPRGMMAVAVDTPLFAQTRLPDLHFADAARIVDGGTVVIQQPGGVIHVDLVDADGAAVREHDVYLEDPRPRSPLVFRPERTNQQGRASFGRLAAGQYRVSTQAVNRCANVTLTTSRVVAMSGIGAVEVRVIVGGHATFRITTPLGPAKGLLVSASPTAPPLPGPPYRSFGCRGTTASDGRVTLMNFPPGPAHVDVPMTNSTYVRQIAVPSDGREIVIDIPEGLLPVRVVNALNNQPVAGATITWTGSGARVEATTTAAGDALLEGAGGTSGTLAASAQGYQPTEKPLTEPQGVPQDIALMPLPRVNARIRVITTSGEPLADAVVALISANPAAVPRVAVTDATGVVTFSDVPSGSLELVASADGFVMSMKRLGQGDASEVVLTLSRGYRVIASVELPAAAGPQLVRVMNDADAPMDDLLDSDSERGLEPPGRLSLGPLPPGTCVIEVRGAGGRRQERLHMIDRDAYTTFR